ncbi:NAD(+)/NADH kinase [Puniceicoccaceae bacterium K14]|nr:NAD(+)/NADH kinase [Puniceicoccaceae bacterium K14]
MKAIDKLAFVVNESKEGARDLADRLETIAQANGVKISHTSDFPVPHGALDDVDACCVIGGDGTFLSVASEATRCQIPLIGVNRGTLGFLTTFSAENIFERFSDVLAGKYSLNFRSLLECETSEAPVSLALNDVVVKSSENARILHVNVFADDEFVTTYVCDGLIFSTPTGSTAYTLSAGGPLIHPQAEVVSLTPICPHTLSNRSIIFPSNVKLRVENARPKEPMLIAVDGYTSLHVSEGCPLTIRQAEKQLPIAQKVDYSHFDVVRTKLKWNGGYAGDSKDV